MLKDEPRLHELRSKLKSALAYVDDRPFSVAKVLGTWDEPHKGATATKAFVCFLKETHLDSCLQTMNLSVRE